MNASSESPQLGASNCFVIATPIGNLRDITLRAIDVLSEVDVIYAEDTRFSQSLFNQYQIKTSVKSLHEHNEEKTLVRMIDQLDRGLNIALISDAGTPLISDPGYLVVNKLAERGYTVVPVPGPCAAIAALSAAGLPTDRFLFKGFLPNKSAARLAVIRAIKEEPGTLVFYEAKHRILESLVDLKSVLGEARRIVVCRELTKQFESFYRGTFSEVHHQISSSQDAQKGEFVVLVEGLRQLSSVLPESISSVSVDSFIELMSDYLPDKHIAQALAKLTGHGKRHWYEYLMSLKKSGA